MIELPIFAHTNAVNPALVDFGAILRPSSGAAVERVNRKGNRFRATVSLAPLSGSDAEIVATRLIRAKRIGLRIPMVLLVPQGSPGSPVVDGAGQAGTSLDVKNLTPNYTAREGYWLSIEDADGQHYLHKIASPVQADASGDATFDIEPELRVPFLDGATIHLATPMIEGFVDGEAWEWAIPVGKLVALSFPIEEAA